MTSIGRVTQAQQFTSAERDLRASRAELAKLQAKATSGSNIQRPSDDPTGAAAALRVRSELAAQARYQANGADGTAWTDATSAALTNSADLVRRASALAVQAGNGALMTPSARESIAKELEGIRDDLLGQAKAQVQGRSVFAAGAIGSPFDQTAAPYTFAASPSGAAGVERRVSATETIRVDVDGTAAFGSGASSVFAAIDSLAATVRAGGDTGPAIDTLTAHQSALSRQLGGAGIAGARIDAASERGSALALGLESRRSSIEDVDPVKILLDLKLQESAYQTSLAVTSRVLQPTLLSYLS